jgi:hypothetical protein
VPQPAFLTRFRSQYGRSAGLTLAFLACLGAIVYIAATPVHGTITAGQPGQAQIVQQSWLWGEPMLLVLMSVSLLVAVTAVALVIRGRHPRSRWFLLAAALLAVFPLPVSAVLMLVSFYLLDESTQYDV